MKLARFMHQGTVRLGIVHDDRMVDLTIRIPSLGNDMRDLIRRWDELREVVAMLERSGDYPLREVELLAPIARPGKIWGIGLNYADHVAESNTESPKFQTWFPMAQTTVTGPYQPIERPRVSTALDYEGELVLVIGKGGRHISAHAAADTIFGYCIGNDVSVRDWQCRSGQFSIGKSFDTHAPFGPWITTADDVDVGSLGIRTYVNGEKRQDSNTAYLIFDPAAQIEHLSQAMTLEPGDVLFTGTPGGVGAVMKPPQYLQAGDKVRVEIDELGFIENEVIDEAP